ncbi:hypothetical protein SYNTR_0103 [Candidatus Syntrophocurvum alkaliphilum]|uniref:Flagellar protein FlaG n=1 Tax=Candidatus Syntrophocurvum alkaliphilum TaxID=2293317 RepID=A0A6I6D5P0_9FIRM|nr:flagellar protein FlaG [Candidatus Syntrophocurvum alkaliphilum]QGT98696.1 hypothetical protein SYNTR_0103 [Candidatus Syntrophocurvum alkaliphilum]
MELLHNTRFSNNIFAINHSTKSRDFQDKVATTKSNIEDFTFAELENDVKKVNERLKSMEKTFEYTIHHDTNRIMVKIFDSREDKLIREIPSEKMLDMLANIQEGVGLIIDEST